jgi:predicted  nucleic acid-binding Zn-ribbon protein
MQDGRKALTVLMATLLVISAISLPLMMARAGVTGNLALTVDKDRGSPDEVVTVSGTAPIGAMVYVDFVRYTGTEPSPGSYEVITSTSVPVGTGGAFKTLITVPHVPMSDETHKYAIYAYVPGFEANTYDYVLFTVVPRLVISPKTTVTPGEVINVTGAGFPESATVDLYAQSYYVGSVGTDERGDFVQVVSWEVQDLPKGTYNVTAVYNGVPIAYAPFTIIPGLYYWNYDAGRWVSLYTISGTWTRDIELGILPLKVWGRGFEAETNVTSIVLRNIYYEYSKVVQNYTTMPLTTATNGSFTADLTLGLTPGGTYDVTVTTLEAYTFKGSLTINPYIEAYDYSKYSATFGIDGRYTIDATRIPGLKSTYARAQVIVFGWAFAPGNVTIAGTTTTVPATFFLDYIENKLVIATVINGTKIDDYTFLPDSNGFSVAIVVMPPIVTRGGHEIGQLQSITVPRLQFSARTNIWVGPTAFFWPPNGTVGPYTTIPYEFKGVGVVKGSIVGPFACLVSGNRTCYSRTPGGKITYNPDLYEEVKKGLGTEITVWGSGFDPNMDVYVFVKGVSPVDLMKLYVSYFGKYGSLLQGLVPDGLLVANTTTDSSGNFNVKFVMPTLPSAPGAGYKVVVLVRTVAGGFDEVAAIAVSALPPAPWVPVSDRFTVLPGIFLNPAIAVGPYVAEVVSTGNPYGITGAVKGVAFRTTNFDSIYGGKYRQDFTDGIMGVNGHVVNWRITANGTLMSILSPYVYPGLFIPTLETGVYEVALILPDGSLTSPVHIGVINDLVLITQIHGNVVEIATRTGTILASLDSIAKSLSDVNAKLESIEGDVATIKTDVATIKADISALKPVITRIDGNVATISTTLGDIKADISALKPVVSEIKDGVATVSTTVGAIKGKVDTIDGNVATIRTDVGTIKAAVTEVKAAAEAAQSAAKSAESVASSLMIPVWIAAAFAIIATIIAIVSVVLIQRKIAK